MAAPLPPFASCDAQRSARPCAVTSGKANERRKRRSDRRAAICRTPANRCCGAQSSGPIGRRSAVRPCVRAPVYRHRPERAEAERRGTGLLRGLEHVRELGAQQQVTEVRRAVVCSRCIEHQCAALRCAALRCARTRVPSPNAAADHVPAVASLRADHCADGGCGGPGAAPWWPWPCLCLCLLCAP